MINPDLITGRLGNKMFLWAYVYSQFREGKIPDTYVQDYRYFDKYKEDLKKIYGGGVGKLPYVGIHVRRGDYVGNTFHTDLSEDTPDGKFPEYYAKAIELFPDDNFLVVSDDTDFARKLFGEIYDHQRFEVVREQNEIEDFNTLASCEKGIITANSSFSFWAAYISNAEKIIAPKEDRWFRDGQIRSHLPENWIKL